MSKMKTLEKEIHALLLSKPETRDSNETLYAYYLHQHLVYSDPVSVVAFFLDFRKYREEGISSFESVTRCRRKLVEKYPQLAPSKEVQEKRKERQMDMWDYAKGRDF